MHEADRYTWNEVLLAVRAYWPIRDRARTLDTVSGVRMLDVSRAYERLEVEEKRALFEGVWLEREPVPAAVIAKMRHYLNGDT